MAGQADLFSLFRSYSGMFEKPSFTIDEFVEFIKKQFISGNAAADSLYAWRDNTRQKVLQELGNLTREGRVLLKEENGVDTVTLPFFYIDQIRRYYATTEASILDPLPTEKTFKMPIPDSMISTVVVESNLFDYMENTLPGDLEDGNDKIIKLLYPSEYGAGLTLASLLREGMLSYLLEKLINAFRTDKTLDYFQSKIAAKFPGKEVYVKEYFRIFLTEREELLTRFIDCDEFTYDFWTSLCYALKLRVEENSRRGVMDINMYQVVQVIPVYINHYKVIATDNKQRGATLDYILRHIQEAPYMWTMYDIMNFKNQSATPITDVVPREDISQFLQEQLKPAGEDALPVLFEFTNINEKTYIVHHNRILLLCEQMVRQNRQAIHDEIYTRWLRILQDYETEDAMHGKSDFEALVKETVKKCAPLFISIAHDSRTRLIEYEANKSLTGKKPIIQLYNGMERAPLSSVFLLDRHEILAECRRNLPFWCTMPICIWLIRLVTGRAARAKNKAEKKNTPQNRQKTPRNALDIAIAELTGGKSIAAALDMYEARWNQKVDRAIREKARTDVNAIVRDSTRYILKLTGETLTSASLRDAADSIINNNGSLTAINDRVSLRSYIELTIVKLIAVGKHTK